MEKQVGTSKLSGIAAQVGCTSFAALMLGSSSAMAIIIPEDTMEYGRIDLSTGPNGKFKFDLNGDGKDDFGVYVDPNRGEIYGLKGRPTVNLVAKKLFSIGDTVDANAKPFTQSVDVYLEDGEVGPNLGLGEGETGYAGLAIWDGQDYFHGWVELTRGSLTGGRTGYQTLANVGAPIPPVPLPASLPLLAVGVGGLAALRRKRRAS